MLGRIHLNKSNVEWLVTELDARPFEKEEFVKEIARSLITLGTIERALSIMYQLRLSPDTLTEYVNLNANDL